jgi:hypothetical protein
VRVRSRIVQEFVCMHMSLFIGSECFLCVISMCLKKCISMYYFYQLLTYLFIIMKRSHAKEMGVNTIERQHNIISFA